MNLQNIKKNINSKGMMLFIILVLVFVIWAIYTGGLLLLKKSITNMVLGLISTVLLILLKQGIFNKKGTKIQLKKK